MIGVVRLPNVPMSNGVSAVSAMTIVIEPIGNAQLLGHDLRQRRADVLADLGLAGEDGDASVFADVEPGRDVAGHGVAAPRASGFLGASRSGSANATTSPAPSTLKKSRRGTSKR